MHCKTIWLQTASHRVSSVREFCSVIIIICSVQAPHLFVSLARRSAAPDGTDGAGRRASAGQRANTGPAAEGGADAYARATEPTRGEETAHGVYLSQLQRCGEKVT